MNIFLDESIQNYLDYLKCIKKAPYHTFRAYQVDLLHFLKYFLRTEKNEIPSSNEMEEYLHEIKNKYNYASYRRKVTTLRNFTTYLIDSGINVPDPFISISLPMPEVKFNQEVNYDDVLNFIDSLNESDLYEIRNKLIFALITKSGLTIKQLLSLKIKDINLASGQIFISKNQLTFLDNKTISLIEKYLSFKKEISLVTLEDYLITSIEKNGKLPLSTRSINLITDKISKEQGFKARLSPAFLRRIFAKSLSENNVSKYTKELILGKKSRLLI